MIFISHRSIEKPIVDELVQFLENIGINKQDIFYSSADSTGVKYRISDEILYAVNNSNFYIIILSNNYYRSPFCLNEAGVIWAKDVKPFIFALDDIDTDNMQGFITNNWLIKRLNSEKDISFLMDELKNNYTLKNLSEVQKNEYKKLYLTKINNEISKIQLSQKDTEKNISKGIETKNRLNLTRLIMSDYFSDKELLLFKFILDKNYFINDIAKNLKDKIVVWEKKNRLKNFLSEDLETLLISMYYSGFFEHRIVQVNIGGELTYSLKQDRTMSKLIKATYQCDDEGMVNRNSFTIKNTIFREIIQLDNDSKQKLLKVHKKYKRKWL